MSGPTDPNGPTAAPSAFAAAAANPFDISVLNGVVFDADNIGVVQGVGAVSQNILGYPLSPVYAFAVNNPDFGFDGTYARGRPVIYGTGDGTTALGFNDPGAIQIVDSSYTAGFTTADGLYAPPVFGRISFGGAYTFEIRGFGEDGRSILLGRVVAGPPQPTAITTNDLVFGLSGGAYVLSLDTLPIYSDANRPAGIPLAFGNRAQDINAFQAAVCFAEGTRIETADGMVAVEDLAQGRLVRTASGALRPVQWIGQMLSRPDRHPRPWEVQPVRVTAHAFGPGLPAREVRLSPGHAVFVDGVLVPVGNLVNGATIVQEAVNQIRYFHVELESHDVLLAEGLPCESYLDDGNRTSFANAAGFTDLHGRLDPKSWDHACAPLVAAGPQLTALQLRLHARAEQLGWTRSEAADLRIEADGTAIMPVHEEGNRFWFLVPAARALVLRSNHGVLAQLVPGLGDGRKLGVAVAELRIDGAAVDLDAPMFGAGFYPAERHEALGWRWTDGAAQVHHALAAPAMIEVALAMVAPSWVRRAPALRVVA